MKSEKLWYFAKSKYIYKCGKATPTPANTIGCINS